MVWAKVPGPIFPGSQDCLPYLQEMAEGVGFEPTDACASPVFKTGAIDHSATLPVPPRRIAGLRLLSCRAAAMS